MSESEFDVIVIGAGPGGYVCAIRAAQLGLKVACVESRDSLGGTCLNVGCIPSKALLESSHRYHDAHHSAQDHGIVLGKIGLDLKKMLGRKDEVVDGITKGVEFLFKKNKITWLRGHGSLDGPGKVKVKGKEGEATYQGKHVIIATGSTPIEIPSAKFDGERIVDSTGALEFSKVPEHLIVVGGGVIGLELGSVWNRLGSKVTVIEAANKILGDTDKAISNVLQKTMKKEGVEFKLNTLLQKAEVKKNKVTVAFQSGDVEESIEGDRVLVAVGRRALTEHLNLESCQVKTDERGRVEVDGRYATNSEGIYAIGDAIAGPMLAHKAEEEGIALAEIIAGQSGHVNYRAIPSIVYTWPEVACLGLSEEQAKKEGIAYKKGQFPFKANGRAKAMGESEGMVKVLADAETDKMIGFHIVGPNASELIAEAVVAFEYGASAEDLARSVHAHPTLTEALKEAALGVDSRTIHA